MDIAALRLGNIGRLRSAEDVVRSLGAVQGQDYGQSLWAIGLRTAAARIADVEEALQTGRVVRTWLMRGTIHYVLAEDVRWMLGLFGARDLARLTPKAWQYHHMTPELMSLARKTFVEALTGGGCLTRREMIDLMAGVGIPDDRQQSYFTFIHLAQEGLVVPGPPRGKEQTFVLLDEWAPKQRSLEGDEAMAVLASRFFGSHGPATLADFANWCGIGVREASRGLEAVKHSLVREEFDGKEYWLPPDLTPGSGAFVLPAYDELLIGYKDRGAFFTRYDEIPISTYNGMFYATIIEDGQIAGLWRRVMKKTSVDVELRPLPGFDVDRLAEHTARFGDFLGLPVRTVVKDAPEAGSSKVSWRSRK
ncbi:winged helix DNA-binding domain-containing protein [Lentzea flaviverrucosa]|uniref:Winged helix DNA-binding domain-containing protein n=1 Tax=Lentzea flaviverrucosa TaxID=200379 RepID=A0A1H9JI18_9PSEU|nr:winged helix DNA-binding domain-containing protein [Lentzea flaviverrucosa]RDI26517.1 winged helix DNA-binding protein [Lentzea flaviverrucosa]SEQ86460.1 Winged helix DNA-binding domain-containing protein [Lentzea flaviverrucosa]